MTDNFPLIALLGETHCHIGVQMRIIKLSKDDVSFPNQESVPVFFESELYDRTPVGEFGITPRKQNMPDIRKGTLLIFSYQTQCMYIGRAAGPVVKLDANDEDFDPDWPAYFVVDMDSLTQVNARLHDYEKELRKATGLKRNLVSDRGWPFLDDKYERFTLKFFQSLLKPLPAIEDLDPPEGTTRPDRAASTHWTYQRDQKVRAYVLRRSRGRCEYCRKEGFLLPNGGRFVETHHIIALAKEGADTPQNVIALCPNHHREAHYGERASHLEADMIRVLRMICRRRK